MGIWALSAPKLRHIFLTIFASSLWGSTLGPVELSGTLHMMMLFALYRRSSFYRNMSAAPSTERVLTFCILDCIIKIPLRIQRRWCMLRPTAAILENNNILYYSTRVHLSIHIKQYMLIRGCITDLVRFSDLQYLFLQNGFAFGLYHDCTVYHTRIDFVYMSFTAICVPSVVLLALYGTSVGVVVNRHRKRNEKKFLFKVEQNGKYNTSEFAITSTSHTICTT